MSSTDRQNRLLLAEDWKKIYQSFKYADFKSYDFDNLRRTMIEYLRVNYPEDFNDYIESSEYLALIDLIAFLGQNISFRVDLNARENFIELAERRESVLRLARLLSYNPQRNKAGNGLLKFQSVSTSENITDSAGRNLSGKTVIWNDSVNTDWYEQFTKVLNAAMPVQNTFGRPIQLDSVGGIATEQYRFNSSSTTTPVYSFSKSVNNTNLDFEIVSTTISNGDLVEEAPLPGNSLAFIYRDNGQGPGSNSTGFFAHFRQGLLNRGDFTIDSPVPNQTIDIDSSNINHTDVWLYKLDSAGKETELWTKVDAVEGNNIVYNNLNKKIKNIYTVTTRTDDRVSLIFSDGIFGTLPKGSFRVYYRTSANKDYTILPANITNVTVRIPYISRIGRTETLTIVLSLKTTVTNASSTETIESIKNNAPATYYTQNRLITAEDYSIGPLAISQEIVKVKSINRTSIGISRYYDLIDATGKYSTTNLFATDGVLFKEKVDKKINFNFLTRTDIEAVLQNQIIPVFQDKNVRNFYLSEYPNQDYAEYNLTWNQVTKDTNRSTGYIDDSSDIIYQVATFTEGPLRFLEPEAMVKFVAPTGKYFDVDGNLVTGAADTENAVTYKWVKVVSVSESGTTLTSSGLGPIVFNDVIPTGAILNAVKPKFVKDLVNDVYTQIISEIFAYRTFGLRYDRDNRQWEVINEDNLNVYDDFSLGQAGDTSNQQLDSSWLLLFETNGYSYTVTYRSLRYIFESDAQIRFYFDNNKKIYDSQTGVIVKDKISVLNINKQPGQLIPFTVDFDWEIASDYRDENGYVDTKKVEVVFYDSDDDGVIDNPDIFTDIVNDATYVFTKKTIINNNEFTVYVNQTAENIVVAPTQSSINLTEYATGTIFYIESTDTFKQYNRTAGTLTQIYDYNAYTGRDNIKFHYIHASDENNRIDPSSSNIIDVYLLTRSYDTLFRQYLDGTIDKPLPPSSDQLFINYGAELAKVKSISDDIVYHPVKYKILFGSKADSDMQAIFKIVKNPNRVVNDNEIKSRVVSSINKFFALDNWDFGETFYFSELSSYIMKDLAPDVSSIVIVPRSATSTFGSLFEITPQTDEIFISGATVSDVEIISSNTTDRLKADGSIVTSTSTSNSGVQSTTLNTTSNTTGGYIY